MKRAKLMQAYRLQFSNDSKFTANSLLFVELYVASSLPSNHDS